MTSKQYRQLLKLLDISQVGAGRLLEIDPRTSRRYALGEMEIIPKMINIILRLMLKYNLTPEDIEDLLKEKIK
jgi:hypothetical protein